MGLALLLVVPLGTRGQSTASWRIGLGCGLIASLSVLLPAGTGAGLLILPWFASCFWNASKALKRLSPNATLDLPRLCTEGS